MVFSKKFTAAHAAEDAKDGGKDNFKEDPSGNLKSRVAGAHKKKHGKKKPSPQAAAFLARIKG